MSNIVSKNVNTLTFQEAIASLVFVMIFKNETQNTKVSKLLKMYNQPASWNAFEVSCRSLFPRGVCTEYLANHTKPCLVCSILIVRRLQPASNSCC